MAVSSEGVPAQTLRPVNFSRPGRWLWLYGPLIIWAMLIFVGSTDLLSAVNTGAVLTRPLHWLFPHASDATLKTMHFVLRKAGHFTEYAILAWLAARAFRKSSRELLRLHWFWLSLLMVVAYALSDESHQSFIASRTGSIYDSMIDSLGGLTMLVLLAVRRRRAVSNGLDCLPDGRASDTRRAVESQKPARRQG